MLTEAGRVLVSSAQDLLSHMEQLEARLQSTTGRPAGRVRVASFATAQRGVVAPALASLRQSCPEVAVSLSEAEPWAAVDLVAGGQVDVAVVHNWEPLPPLDPGARAQPGARRRCRRRPRPRRPPPGGSTSVTPADVADEHWVSVSPGSICHQWLTKMLHDVGRVPLIDCYSQEFASHIALVEQGLAIALVPRLGRGPLPRGSWPFPSPTPCPRVGSAPSGERPCRTAPRSPPSSKPWPRRERDSSARRGSGDDRGLRGRRTGGSAPAAQAVPTTPAAGRCTVASALPPRPRSSCAPGMPRTPAATRRTCSQRGTRRPGRRPWTSTPPSHGSGSRCSGAEDGQPGDDVGYVEFRAHFRHGSGSGQLHERSRFARRSGGGSTSTATSPDGALSSPSAI